MNEQFEKEFQATLDTWEEKLLSISEGDSMTSREKGKWCPKEILGHLIDSAFNNHRRFVLARRSENLIFEGYEQERWIEAQNYTGRPWRTLILFWKDINTHLLHVMCQLPEETLSKEHFRHNFYDIASRPIPEGQSTTLQYFAEDYVWHMKHHLHQIADQRS